MMRALVITALLVASTAVAEKPGLDLLGLQSAYFNTPENCSAVLKAFDGHSEINFGYLEDSTFANVPQAAKNNCRNSLLADPRTKSVKVVLVNGVCPKYPRCQPFEFYSQFDANYPRGYPIDKHAGLLRARDFTTIQRWQTRAAEVCNDLKEHLREDQECYIQPELESHVPPDAATVIYDYIWTICTPRCHMAWAGNGTLPGTWKEGHGRKPNVSPPCLTSTDGTDIDLSVRKSKSKTKMSSSQARNWIDQYANCSQTNLWISEFNGVCQGGGWVWPHARTCWPSAAMLKAVTDLLPRGGVQPTMAPVPTGAGLGAVCSIVQPVEKPHLWKPRSEDSGGSRQDKPVWIMAGKKWGMKQGLHLYNVNGLQVGHLGYYGAFESSGERYYLCYGNGSCETPEQLKAEAGGPVYVQGPGNGCFGPIDPTTRVGAVR